MPKPKRKIPFSIIAGAALAVILIILLIPKGNQKNLSIRQRTPKLRTQSLFIGNLQNLPPESPALSLVQGNSLLGVSPAETFSYQVLSTMTFGGENSIDTRKEITEYKVEKGDTLSKIAEKFNISLNTVLWANDLSKRSVIRPGQKLIILPVSGVMHLVKPGDTLTNIAKTYKGDVDEIIAFNHLSEDGKIYIGDALIIPDGVQPRIRIAAHQIPVGKSYFIYPTVGWISQRLHPINAIDVANKCGTAIYAAAAGKVQKVSRGRRYGNYIRILHPNNVVTLYAHLSGVVVKPGQSVSQGDIIGYMGHTGYTIPKGPAGCHLHFEVRGAKNFLAGYPLHYHLKFK